jgi:hypothetical protein
MKSSVSVLCVLCAFVVKPLSVAVLHRSHRALWVSFIPHRSLIPHRSPVAPLHRSSTVPARKSTTLRSNVIHPNRHVGHPNRSFSTLRASSISVGPVPLHDMHIFDVIKCHHFYRQLPPAATPSKGVQRWLNVTQPDNLARCRLPYFIPHPSSFIPKCGMHYNNGLRQPEREKNRLDWPASMASFSLYNNKGPVWPPPQPDSNEQRIEQRQPVVHRLLSIVS